jgi:hypothetical protein
MRIILSTIVLAAVLATGVARAEAKQVRYVGVHPVPDKAGGGMCYIEAPHVHVYAPHKPEVLYRKHNGDHYFVGDPVAHSYDGPRHSYYGHHPIHVDVVVHDAVTLDPEPEYCYLDGPHYHGFAPPAGATFELKGEAYWYVGTYPAYYKQHKKRYVGINAVYRPIVYARPVIEVEPPVAYVGPVIAVGAPVIEVAGPAVEVRGPAVRAGVEVHIPVPTIEVGFGVGVHHVHSHDCGHHGHGKFKRVKHKKFKGKHRGRVRVRDHRR